MEEIVALLAPVGVALVAFQLLRAKRSSGSAKRPASSKLPSPRRRSALVGGAEHARFDETSAKPVNQERILTGLVWVTDGDTIKIKNIQIRLFGIDAPELSHPYGKKAKWALYRLCKGQIVRAEVTDEDKHGRTVARCFLPDGRDLSAEMVKEGLALDWPKYSGGQYRRLESPDARRKLFLADARQNGRMHVWERFEARNGNN